MFAPSNLRRANNDNCLCRNHGFSSVLPLFLQWQARRLSGELENQPADVYSKHLVVIACSSTYKLKSLKACLHTFTDMTVAENTKNVIPPEGADRPLYWRHCISSELRTARVLDVVQMHHMLQRESAVSRFVKLLRQNAISANRRSGLFSQHAVARYRPILLESSKKSSAILLHILLQKAQKAELCHFST